MDAGTSRLGKGSQARGRLTGKGPLELYGELVGELVWDGPVTVGPEARLQVDGRVDALDLRGWLAGRVEVRREARVFRGARWFGAGAAPSMATEAGAWFDGEFRVRPSD